MAGPEMVHNFQVQDSQTLAKLPDDATLWVAFEHGVGQHWFDVLENVPQVAWNHFGAVWLHMPLFCGVCLRENVLARFERQWLEVSRVCIVWRGQCHTFPQQVDPLVFRVVLQHSARDHLRCLVGAQKVE